jgi:Skp family chaperone for outer membrane proteins
MKIRSFSIILAIMFFTALVCIPAFAQSRPKIVAVDTEKGIGDSIWGKKTLEELGKDRDEWRKKLDQFKKEQLQPLEEQLAKQRQFLEDKQAEEKLQNDINMKLQDMERMIQEGNTQLQDKQDALLKPILEELKDIIKRLSIKEGYDIVIEQRVMVLYINPELDITSQITTMLDEVYKQKIAPQAKETESAKKDTEKPETVKQEPVKDEKTQK